MSITHEEPRLIMKRGQLYRDKTTGHVCFYSGRCGGGKRPGNWAAFTDIANTTFMQVSRDWVPKRFTLLTPEERFLHEWKEVLQARYMWNHLDHIDDLEDAQIFLAFTR